MKQDFRINGELERGERMVSLGFGAVGTTGAQRGIVLSAYADSLNVKSSMEPVIVDAVRKQE